MPASEAKLKYLRKYAKEQCKNYSLRLSYAHCQDVIDYFAKNGCQSSVIRGVRKLIEEENKNKQ